MALASSWDWKPGRRSPADMAAVHSLFKQVHELSVSPDGEKIAAPVKQQDDTFTVCVNGEAWPAGFEKVWHVRFTPSGRAAAFVMSDGAWTVAVDGAAWEETFEYVWNPRFASKNGVESIAVAAKKDNQYCVALNGKSWETTFVAMRDFDLSPDGSRAAITAQVEALKEADVEGFFKGVWSVAVDGERWSGRYVNVWRPVFSADGSEVAAEIRTGICEYSIAVNGVAWPELYDCVWEAVHHPRGGFVAPVRMGGAWFLAHDGKLLWNRRYVQLWHQRFSPDGSRIAAVAAPEFGKWTIAVDDQVWPTRFDEMVLAPVFSPDSRRVAAAVKDAGKWTIAVDGRAWPLAFDMVWDPVFSPCGEHALAKVEKGGRYYAALDGKLSKRGFEQLFEPLFSPDGKAILLKYIEDGKYWREVVPAAAIVG